MTDPTTNSTPPRFFFGAIDYNGPIANNYGAGRALSPEAAATWRTAIEPYIQPRRGATILDLGSGTGRFSRLLADSFAARVIGAEPSTRMLTTAMRDPRPQRVTYLAASAERLPFRDRLFDVAWLS